MHHILARPLRCFPPKGFRSSLEKSQLSRGFLHRRDLSMEHAPLEEQTLLRFHEKRYYPVRIGQTFNDRYRILTKLGFGAYSTVWLARDQKTNEYTAVKVFVRDDSKASPVANEINILRHITACSEDHAGATLARLADDMFEVDGHSCLAMKPQACSLQYLQSVWPDNRIPPEFMMGIIMRLLGCINWLHLDCGVAHTEIIPQNIMLGVNDDTISQRAEEEELAEPSIPFIVHTHSQPYPIYPSRGQPRTILEVSGHSILADFGSARLLRPSPATEGWWMPDTYRAPEVLMGNQWDHGVDIWSIGMLVLELLEGKPLFNPVDRVHNQYVLPLALAQYIGYMGPPPLRMIQASTSPYIATFFDEQGAWIADPPIQTTRLEDFVTVIEPGEEKTLFLNFIRKIFTWEPSERASSSELAEDEWLTAPFRARGILP